MRFKFKNKSQLKDCTKPLKEILLNNIQDSSNVKCDENKNRLVKQNALLTLTSTYIRSTETKAFVVVIDIVV